MDSLEKNQKIDPVRGEQKMHEWQEALDKLAAEDENSDVLEVESTVEDTQIADMFSPKQRLAIELYGRGKITNVEVARVVGVSVKTIERWRKDENFKNEIKLYEGRRASERRSVILDKVDAMQLDAVNVLEELLKSDKESIKLKAALAVLDVKKKVDGTADNAVEVSFLGMPVPAMPVHEIHKGET